MIKFVAYALACSGDVSSLGVAGLQSVLLLIGSELLFNSSSQPLSLVAPPVQCCWAHNYTCKALNRLRPSFTGRVLKTHRLITVIFTHSLAEHLMSFQRHMLQARCLLMGAPSNRGGVVSIQRNDFCSRCW